MLTNKQNKQLRSLAHPLRFIIQTGEKGLTEAVQKEISIAINAHELIKIKLNAERKERDKMIKEIVDYHKCDIVQYVGKTITIFKQNKNAKKIEIIK